MDQNNILLGGDLNAHSDRWDPGCPPKQDANVLKKFLNEYDLMDVTDGEATYTSTRNSEISRLIIDFFVRKASITNR